MRDRIIKVQDFETVQRAVGPRFRDWADIFRDASFSHRPFYTTKEKMEHLRSVFCICSHSFSSKSYQLVWKMISKLSTIRKMAKTVFWKFDSIIMQNKRVILLLFCTPTWRLITWVKTKNSLGFILDLGWQEVFSSNIFYPGITWARLGSCVQGHGTIFALGLSCTSSLTKTHVGCTRN